MNFYCQVFVVFFVVVFFFTRTFHAAFAKKKKKKVKSEHELALLNFYCHKHFLKDHWIGKCVGVSFFLSSPLSPLFSFSIDADLTSWNGCCFVFQMHLACVPARRWISFTCVFTAFFFFIVIIYLFLQWKSEPLHSSNSRSLFSVSSQVIFFFFGCLIIHWL